MLNSAMVNGNKCVVIRKLYCYMILPLMAFVSGCQHEEFMPAEQNVDVMEVYATIE